MKIETAELEFIRCNKGNRHFSLPVENYVYRMSIEDVYTRLTEQDKLTPDPPPDPLEEALEAVDELCMQSVRHHNLVKAIIRKLAAALTA